MKFEVSARRRGEPGVPQPVGLPLALALLLVVPLSGCVSKAESQARARAAFQAGQQQALERVQQARDLTVTVVGQVRNPVVQWTSDLTVAKAILAAGYFGPSPTDIVILRDGQENHLDPKKLLDGEDPPLESGDVVRIK